MIACRTREAFDWPEEIITSIAAQEGLSNDAIIILKYELCNTGHFFIGEDGELVDPSMVVENGKIKFGSKWCLWRSPDFNNKYINEEENITFKPLR